MKNTARINRSPMAGLAIVLTLSMSLLSCGGDGGGSTTPTTPSDPVFRQLVALSTVTDWEQVWGVSASDMFVMGEDGYVYRGDGFTWSPELSTVKPERVVYSAWGATADDAFFAGRIILGDTLDIDGVPVYRDVPILEEYNGTAFSSVGLVGVEWGLYDIWGAAADTIFAVGFDGTILNYNGADWSVMATGGTSPAWLNAVWGTSGSSVYASGTKGALLHYDGSAWSVIRTHSIEDLWDVWGFSDSSVYCVGSGGTVLHYDGSSVTEMTTPISNALYSLWGYAEDDLYAVGWAGAIIHYDGSVWTEVDSRTKYGFLSIWGTSGGPLYVVGQTALRYDGANWTPITIRNEPDFADIWASADSSGSEVVAVGTGGNILFRTSSFSFSSMTVDGETIMTDSTDLNGVGGYGDEALFVVGDGGLILERVAGTTDWTDVSPGLVNDLSAVAVLSDSLAVTVGAAGTIGQYDGSGWTEPAVGLVSADLFDVWLGLTSEDTTVGYAVGDQGVIADYDGSLWRAMTSPTSTPLRSVVGVATGEAYAVGDNGTLVYFNPDTDSWTGMASGTSENLTSIWAADATHMFIAGGSGRVFSFDGNSLTELETNTGFDLTGIAGLDATDVYVVGANNHILRYSR